MTKRFTAKGISMAITINANDVDDALAKLRRHEPHYGIKIRWRKGEAYDYETTMLTGCIVNAVGMPGQEVERSFTSAKEALKYIASLLKVVEDRAKEQKAEREKRERELKQKVKNAK
jgi:hypothetical protein